MRVLVGEFENAFRALHEESLELLDSSIFVPVGPDEKPTGGTVSELIVRSAAKVEQCFGGISARLWDDPYEWTLPESFLAKTAVFEYLGEVKAVREGGFKLLRSDRELAAKIAAPAGMVTIFDVLLSTLTESNRQLALAAYVSRDAI